MSEKDKKYFYRKLLGLRKSIQLLEEELGNQLGEESPVLPKRKNQMKDHFVRVYEHGIRTKPPHLRKIITQK